MLELDHLVVVAETLQAGVAHVEQTLGVRASPGGKHGFMGTHNALWSLGPATYLEVIAIDPEARAPAHARWFGMDSFAGPPRLTNWVCRTADLDAALAAGPQDLGQKMRAARGRLEWQMAVPGAGQYPFDGAFPGVISWQAGGHPCDKLPDRGLRLEMLEIATPFAEEMAEYHRTMFDLDKIRIVRSAEKHLSASISVGGRSIVLT